MNLYNKYRPKTFDEVVGHKVILDSLTSRMQNNKLSQAFILAGQKGTGKTTIAKLLARYLSCESPNGYEPCNECNSCLSAIDGRHPDILEVDGASNNGVSDVKAWKEDLKFAPIQSKYKIYIVDEVHRLSGNAFDALLTTVESPPENVIFIFATTEFHKIPPTIRSRCEIHTFARMSVDLIKNQLLKISRIENIDINDQGANLIAANSDGSMRDGISILEKLSSGKIDQKVVMNSLGLIDESITNSMIESLIANDLETSMALYQCIINKGKTATQLIESIIILVSEHISNGKEIVIHAKLLKLLINFRKDVREEKNVEVLFNTFIVEQCCNDTSIEAAGTNNIITQSYEVDSVTLKGLTDRITKIEDWIKKVVQSKQASTSKVSQNEDEKKSDEVKDVITPKEQGNTSSEELVKSPQREVVAETVVNVDVDKKIDESSEEGNTIDIALEKINKVKAQLSLFKI